MMVFTHTQIELTITLFAKAFSSEKDENLRRELCVSFDDTYSGIIKDWKSYVEEQIIDEETLEEFRKIAYKSPNKTIDEEIKILPLSKDDFEQISYLGLKELGLSPWIPDEFYSAEHFLKNGLSFVAKKDNIVLGFIFADIVHSYGGYKYVYIDTLAIAKYAQGQGIGKLLLKKLQNEAYNNRIHRMKLMTKKNIPAYKIYKHLGFNELPEEYTTLECYNIK